MDEHTECIETAVRVYQRRLIALAFSILRNLEQAKDEVQNAFLQLARRHCPSIRNREAWLVTVCRNGALKAAARRRPVTGLTDFHLETLPDEGAATGGDAAEKRERATLLIGQLDTLPPKQREVLRLHYFSGLKPAQIAEVLGERPNNVYQLHFAGLVSLRKRMSVEPEPR